MTPDALRATTNLAGRKSAYSSRHVQNVALCPHDNELDFMGKIMENRKPGRPRSAVTVKYKSISVPESVWNELNAQATSIGVSVGKLACERILNGGVSEEFIQKFERKNTQQEVDF